MNQPIEERSDQAISSNEAQKKAAGAGDTKSKLERIRVWLLAPGLLVSAGALVCAAYGINEQHKWYRRHFAVEMIREWNNHSNTHKAAIENAYPQLFREEGPQQSRPRIDKEEARRIYFSIKDDGSGDPTKTVSANGSGDPTKIVDSKRWDTRNHCIALLNYFEFVASAWENQVADRKMIEDSFKKTILRWHHDLEEFMSVMRATRQYEPWLPLQRVVAKWKADEIQVQDVRATGSIN